MEMAKILQKLTGNIHQAILKVSTLSTVCLHYTPSYWYSHVMVWFTFVFYFMFFVTWYLF